MKKTQKRIIWIACAAGLLAILALIPKNKGGRPEMKAETTVYSVKTEKINLTDLQEYMKVNGTVKADNSISVYPDASGKLSSVSVTLGDYVKRGQVIAQVDPSVPGSHYALSPVIAPIDGYVTSLPLTRGTTVSTSTAVASIGKIDKLQIEVLIPESKIAGLKKGLTAEVRLEAYKDETFPAHVFRVSPIVDETSRTKEVYFLFDTSDSRINAGMYVSIKLNTILHEKAIAIPTDAITSERGKSYVYVMNSDGSTVKKTEVTKGVTVDGITEITAGLSEGLEIVTSGMQVLSDGVTVKIVGGEK